MSRVNLYKKNVGEQLKEGLAKTDTDSKIYFGGK